MAFWNIFVKKPQKTVPVKKKFDIVCPFCFEKFDPDDVVFRAAHWKDDDEDYRLQEDEILNKWRAKFGLADVDDLECCINPNDIPAEDVEMIAGEVLYGIKDKRGVLTRKRLCPFCHNDLPMTAGRVPSNIISFIGASQVGKSVYMTSLIHTLQRVTAGNFSAACMPINQEAGRKFREEYESPIFESGVMPNSTQKEKAVEPSIFELTFKDKSKPPLMLVFFDVAGEGMVDQEYLRIRANHIKNSAGILFLIDPVQIKSIRDKISLQKGDTPGDFTYLSAEPREVLISLFENFIGHNENTRTDIHTAVVLAKSDMLKLLKDDTYIKPNSNIFKNVIHEKYFSLSEFENINGEVRRFIEKVDKPFKDAVDVLFDSTAYFAVSALGSNPVGMRIQGVVEPIRVDEPFLWLLYKLNYIEGREEL